MENDFFQVREKSGNFVVHQELLKTLEIQVREKLGNLKIVATAVFRKYIHSVQKGRMYSLER